MTGVGFLILFGLSCVLFSCEGKVYSAYNGTTIFPLPGSTATLKWPFDGDPKASLVWYFTRRGSKKDSEELAHKYRTKDVVKNKSASLPRFEIEMPATLVLTNVNERYNGKYRLSVQILGDGYNSDVYVSIAVTPNVTINCSNSTTLNEGDNFTCVCRGESENPPVNVTWYKGSNKIGHGGTGKEEQTLTLRNVNGTDTGTYKCVAKSHVNATNERSIEVIVKLNFKPDPSPKRCRWWCILLIVIAVMVVFAIICYVVYKLIKKYCQSSTTHESFPLDDASRSYEKGSHK